MRSVLIVLCLFVSSFIAGAQAFNSTADGSIFWGDLLEREHAIPYNEIQGSPYHRDELVMGTIIMNSGDTLNRYIRYNAYTDEIEYVDKNRVYALAEPHKVGAVYVNGITYRYKNFTGGMKIKSGFFIELVGGSCGLYRREIVKYKPYENPKTSYHQPVPAKFIKLNSEIYYGCPDPILRVFSNSGTVINDISAGDPYSVDEYIKSNKLKLRKEKDVVKLFQYLNGQEINN